MRNFITFSDLGLLIKKIIVGLIVTAIPFLIVYGGLTITRKVLQTEKREETKAGEARISWGRN
jgi:hypothetical protein